MAQELVFFQILQIFATKAYGIAKLVEIIVTNFLGTFYESDHSYCGEYSSVRSNYYYDTLYQSLYVEG